jgi:hypothetical protein
MTSRWLGRERVGFLLKERQEHKIASSTILLLVVSWNLTVGATYQSGSICRWFGFWKAVFFIKSSDICVVHK